MSVSFTCSDDSLRNTTSAHMASVIFPTTNTLGFYASVKLYAVSELAAPHLM